MSIPQFKHRVAVYGTLKRGFSNHHLLQHADYLGEAVLTDITLYDLGWFPAARLEPSRGVRVEVFDIDESTLEALDQLEGYHSWQPEHSFYQRHQLSTPLGMVWVYIYNRPVQGLEVITKGEWLGAPPG